MHKVEKCAKAFVGLLFAGIYLRKRDSYLRISKIFITFAADLVQYAEDANHSV